MAELSVFWKSPPPGYELGPCIGGRSGFTRVFAARDLDNLTCALKTLVPAAAEQRVRVARFMQEIELHSAASSISGVASARSAGDGWLRVEWAHGGDLDDAVSRSDNVNKPSALRPTNVLIELLRTVAELHELGIAHRDIKPSNLLLDGGRLLLTDFGIAAKLAGNGDRDEWRALPRPFRELTAGTPAWSAPELLGRSPLATPASDVYGVAKIYRWFSTLSAEDASGKIAPPKRSAINDLVVAMTSKDPQQRPSAAEALDTLVRCLC